MKTPMVDLHIQYCILLLFSESTQDNQCVCSLEILLVVIKDYSLCCQLLCQRYHLSGAQLKFLGDSAGFWSEFKVFIKQPQTVNTTTSFSAPLFYCLELGKLVSISPLNLTFMEKFIQTSSRQGQERSFSTSSFSKERIISPTFL